MINSIWYYTHIAHVGYLPGREPSLQSALRRAEQITGAHDDDDLTIVEITESGPAGARKKTGFFDKWGYEVTDRPVGLPLTI